MRYLKIIISLIFFIFLSLEINAKEKVKYWIFFKDKGENYFQKIDFGKDSYYYSIAKNSVSSRAIERRIKRFGELKFDYSDLPINQNYIFKLKQLGIEVENSSRWFNGVTAYLEEDILERLKNLDFIKSIQRVNILVNRDKANTLTVAPNDPLLSKITTKYNYGLSLTQNQMINVPKVHDLGIEGSGVLVGLMDTGFDWRRHNALKNLKVLREYDFIFRDSITANESNDISGQDGHGTLCFSILAGYAPDTLIGPSFKSEFILAKTEDVRSETKIEEDNWVSAVEWMESLGVDVVSSSLGYNEFDNGVGNYTYKDMNGETAIITRAADIAVTKGMVVVVSAGNEGSTSWRYITAPADGKNVISVGAVLSNGQKASFSSIGPTYDGRIKPDVSALGVSVYHAVSGTKSSYSYSSGTSVACPLVAGVASLILSARPDLTPFQVRDALRNTASQNTNPNNEIGWGVIDAYKALTYNGLVFSNGPEVVKLSTNVKVSIYVASSYQIDKSSVKIYYSTDGLNYSSLNMTQEKYLDEYNSGLYSVNIPIPSNVNNIYCYFSASDTKGLRKHPYNAPNKNFNILNNNSNTKLPDNYTLYQNYPNPFNPDTRIKFSIPKRTKVSLNIYNLLGQLVKTIVDESLEPNDYIMSWNGKDNLGNDCVSGVYLYNLVAGDYKQTKKMLLIK